MSDLLALRPTPLQAVREPLPTPPLSVGESVGLAFSRQQATGNAFSEEANLRAVFQDAQAAFAEADERLENPYGIGFGAGFLDDLGRIGGIVAAPAAGTGRVAVEEREREERIRRWDAAAERLRAARPDEANRFPTSAELRLRADFAALETVRRDEEAAPVASGFGRFLGATGAIFTDPVQVATLPIGAPWRLGATLLGNVVRTALVEGTVAGATQAAVELRADPYRQRLGLESEAAEQIGMAFAGGAVIGGALRGVLGLVAGRSLPDTPAGVVAGDAVRAARTQLIEQGWSPAGPEAAGAHLGALEAARAQMARGEAVTVALEPPRPTRYATEREARLASAEGAAADAAAPGQRYVAFTPAGRAVTVEARVVELDALIASHTPDGVRNPAYPHDEGIQPRPRGAAPLQDQVRDIAARLEPVRLMPSAEAGAGAPIVGPDLVVESGNGRVAALTLAYRSPDLTEQAAAYRAALAARGYAVEGMREPVVVATRVSALTPDERANFVREANARATAESTAAQRARDDARVIGPALPLWRGGDVDSVANAPFVRRALEALGPNERAGLLDAAGRLNSEGVRRIGDAVVARAFGDEAGELLELLLGGTNDGMRQAAGALRDVAGQWARMRQAAAAGEIDPAMDVTADLVAALRLMNDARRAKLRVRDLVAQTDIERPPPTDTTRALLAAMHRDPDMTGPLLSRQAIGQRLAGYVETAMDTQPGGGLFDLPPVRPGERIAAAARAEDGAAAVRTEAEAPVARPFTEQGGTFRVQRVGGAPGDAFPPHGLYLTSTADAPYNPAGDAIQLFDATPANPLRVAVPEDMRRPSQRITWSAGTEAARVFLGDAEVDRLLRLSDAEARAEAAARGVDLPADRAAPQRLVEILGATEARRAGHDAIVLPHRTSHNEPPEMVVLSPDILAPVRTKAEAPAAVARAEDGAAPADSPGVDSVPQRQEQPGQTPDSLAADSLPEEPPMFRFDPAPVDPAVAAAKRLAEVEADLAARRGLATDRAALNEARRAAAERDLPVPDGPDGATRGAREILDEAEDVLRDADEAVACMVGVAA